MPAVIFGERFRGRGVPAWHGIGEIFQDDPSATEAFDLASMLYEVYRTPIYADVPNLGKIEVPGKYAIVRDQTRDAEPKFLAVVGDEFKPVQNRELANMVDRSGLLRDYQIETVGALGDGETVFVALSERDGEFEIAGTPVRNYWTMANGHDGNRALTIMNTPVKTVCSNTLIMALKAANLTVKISHGKTAADDFRFWLNLAPQMKRAQEESRKIIGHLAEFYVTEDEASRIIQAAYPAPKALGKAQLKDLVHLDLSTSQAEQVDRAVSAVDRATLRQLQKGELAREVFRNYGNVTEEKALAGTAWGVYEAVVDVEDHRAESRKTENPFQSAMFGARARSKRDAFSEALKVAGIRG